MSTQRWQDVLGVQEPIGRTYPTIDGESRGINGGALPRLEQASDSSYPRPDTRRGGRAGSSSTITPPNTQDPDTIFDGYSGRGHGRGYTSPSWDESRG